MNQQHSRNVAYRGQGVVAAEHAFNKASHITVPITLLCLMSVG